MIKIVFVSCYITIPKTFSSRPTFFRFTRELECYFHQGVKKELFLAHCHIDVSQFINKSYFYDIIRVKAENFIAKLYPNFDYNSMRVVLKHNKHKIKIEFKKESNNSFSYNFLN